MNKSTSGMPVFSKKGMIPTLNNMGFMFEWLDPYAEEFIEHAASLDGEVLEVGCAFGVVTLRALEKGARICACDMEPRHLEILQSKVPPAQRSRLRCVAATLPEADFPENAFAAIFSSRVLHFMNGDDIEASVSKMFRWVEPCGKVILVADTPYNGIWGGFAPTYEANKKAGEKWPGYIDDCAAYIPKRSKNVILPPFMNFLDPDIMRRVCEEAGFIVERTSFEDRPASEQGTGNDHVGIVAVKPERG